MKKLFYLVGGVLIFLSPCSVYAETSGASNAKANVLATPALNMTSKTYNSVTFTISKVEGATTYQIERATNANFTTYETISTKDLKYTDKNLVTGNTYYYRIAARGNNATSNKSTAITVKMELDTPEINVEKYSYNSLKLNITPVKGASYYKVIVKKYSTTVQTFNTTKTANIIENLENGNSYDIYVTAYTKTTNGDVASDVAYNYQTVKLPPVSNINLKVNKNNEITISYNAVPGVSTYVIYRSEGYSGYEEIVRTTGTTYVDTKLDGNKSYSYRVEALASANNETYTSYDYSRKYVYPLKSLAKPKLTVKKTNEGYYARALEFKVSEVAYASAYYIYEIDYKNQYNEIGTIYDAKDTLKMSYVDYGNYKYAVRAYNYNAEVYSDYTIINFSHIPEKPSISIKKVKYNENKITIKAPTDNKVNNLSYDTKYKYEVYRSTDNKKYTLVKTLTGKDVYSDLVYTDKIKDAKPGKIYYYRVKLVINKAKSQDSNTVKMKSVIPKPTIKVKSDGGKRTITTDNLGSGIKYIYYASTKKDGKYKKICETTKTSCSKTVDWTKTNYYKVVATLNGKKYSESKIVTSKANNKTPNINVYNSANDKQIIKYDSLGKDVKYIVYRATSKNGKYKKICETTKTSCSVDASWNKTYYYKVKAYVTVDKKKKYTKYSKVKSRKVTMVAIDKYPLTLTTNYGDAKSIIKGITFTKKSSGSKTKYTMKFNYKSKYSNIQRKVYYTVYFYNYDLTKSYSYKLTETFYRGTRKNTSTTYDIKLPKWAMFYYFK